MKIAIIRIRGGVRVNTDIIDTLDMLKLHKKNFCVIYENTPSLLGMVKKTKDYITWGEIDEDTAKLLIEKRAVKTKEGIKPFFRLNPPKGGFERKGTKKGYSIGGALGYRGKDINKLIQKMI